jgi:serine/threonine protein phosphatase PrpC
MLLQRGPEYLVEVTFSMAFLTEIVSRVGGRGDNEDCCSFALSGNAGCWVVADGLGGHCGGQFASRAAVDAVLDSFGRNAEISEQILRSHLEAAQNAVMKLQGQQPALSTMRTTIVVLIAEPTHALWAHIGDSRLYCFEHGRLAFQTSDHSVVQRMVDAGELSPRQGRHHEDRNRLLRCLGNSDPEFRPTLLPSPHSISCDSAFLLCTDGFWEKILENEMVVDMAKAAGPSDWLTLMEHRLLERAADGDDNYSGVAVMLDDKVL